MPYVTLGNPQPAPNTIGTIYGSKDETKSEAKSTPERPRKETLPLNADIKSAEECPMNAYPVVKLDVDTISDAAAARLATSLLGHVLFLKNQVPFPVMQLGRLPGGKPNSRAFKQRAELLASYDTISSHLDTTFSALATALARCSDSSTRKVAQAHVAILVGPSLGTAKSKVMLGIDGLGLEIRIWGAREDAPVAKAEEEEESEEEEEEEEESSSAEESDGSAEEPEDSDDDDGDDGDGTDGDEEGEEEDADESGKDDDNEAEGVENQKSSPPPPSPYISYAEEQRFLQNADRLLSRTLAAADAEGKGILSEMSPTQTHVLIRAPRRFTHPAWIPRQNVTAALNNALLDFLDNSGIAAVSGSSLPRQNRTLRKNKLEGVWITARSGIQQLSTSGAETLDASDKGQNAQSAVDDADEMIWWSWDGKFVGFNDW